MKIPLRFQRNKNFEGENLIQKLVIVNYIMNYLIEVTSIVAERSDFFTHLSVTSLEGKITALRK